MNARRACIAFALLAGCGRGLAIRIEGLPDRAFLDDRSPLSFVATGEGVGTFRARLDGNVVVDVPGVDGRATFTLPAMSRGRHELVVEAGDGLSGFAATRTIFVDRMPDTRVAAVGETGSDWLATIASTHAVGDGSIAAGRLSIAEVPTSGAGAVSRTLSEDAVVGAVGPGDSPEVAWIDSWTGDAGTLHAGAVADSGGGASFDGVRKFVFAPRGGALAAVDRGSFVLRDGALVRVADEASDVAFAGPVDDLVSFDGDASGLEGRATVAAAPGYSPHTVPGSVLATYRPNPALREIEFDPDAPVGPIVYETAANESEHPFGDAAYAVAYSPDGRWLLGAVATTAGIFSALADRSHLPSAITRLPYQLALVSFSPDSSRLFGVDPAANLVAFDLGADPSTPVILAPQVYDYGLLAGGAFALEGFQGGMSLRTPGGALVDEGLLDAANPEIVLAPDGSGFAFAKDDRKVRRVNAVTGAATDFGVDAHHLTFLGGGAFAWAERRADGVGGGLANDDLWIFPAFPASIEGARMVAQRVKSDVPFAVSPDGDTLAVLSDLPTPGTEWAGEARCFDEQARGEDLGPADEATRVIEARADGRVLWFGPDRDEPGVLWLARCAPR